MQTDGNLVLYGNRGSRTIKSWHTSGVGNKFKYIVTANGRYFAVVDSRDQIVAQVAGGNEGEWKSNTSPILRVLDENNGSISTVGFPRFNIGGTKTEWNW